MPQKPQSHPFGCGVCSYPLFLFLSLIWFICRFVGAMASAYSQQQTLMLFRTLYLVKSNLVPLCEAAMTLSYLTKHTLKSHPKQIVLSTSIAKTPCTNCGTLQFLLLPFTVQLQTYKPTRLLISLHKSPRTYDHRKAARTPTTPSSDRTRIHHTSLHKALRTTAKPKLKLQTKNSHSTTDVLRAILEWAMVVSGCLPLARRHLRARRPRSVPFENVHGWV